MRRTTRKIFEAGIVSESPEWTIAVHKRKNHMPTILWQPPGTFRCLCTFVIPSHTESDRLAGLCDQENAVVKMCDFQGWLINDIATSASVLGGFALEAASCHVVRILKQLCRKAHMEKSHLEGESADNRIEPSDNSNLSQHLTATPLETQSQNIPTEPLLHFWYAETKKQ